MADEQKIHVTETDQLLKTWDILPKWGFFVFCGKIY